jgi:hypothetical protein
MSSGQRHHRTERTGLRRLALLLACLMFFLHSAGEVFHWRAHLMAPSAAVPVLFPIADSTVLTAAPAVNAPHENCPLCLLNGLSAPLALASLLLTAAQMPFRRRTLPFQDAAVRIRRFRRGPPRAPPAFA